MSILTTHQQIIADRVLADESAQRRHLVVSLSGAHAYGFPSPDSDLDLKAVHMEPTVKLLGLTPPTLHASRFETIQGVEIDYSSNEVQPVLAAILGGNGNYFERFLGAITIAKSPELEQLRPIVKRALSKRIHRHYSGFARAQLHEWEKSGYRSAKKLLYVLRTALTGTHALLTGDIITDVTCLLDEYEFGEARELVEAKKRGERSELALDIAERWKEKLGRAFDSLDRALTASRLPDEATNRDELEAWLIDLRRKEL